MSASWWKNILNPSAMQAAAQKAGVDISYLQTLDIPFIGKINTPYKTYELRQQDLPALRQIIKHQLPNAKPHERIKIEDIASKILGSPFSELSQKENMNDYLHEVNRLGQARSVTDTIKLLSKLIDSVNNEYGRAPTQYENSDLAAKQTLAARFIQPGAEILDTTIPKKLESIIAGDLFNYWADGNGDGVYNGLYLNDAQYNKDVRFREPLNLPRSGDDQLYFPGWVIDPRYANEQPVELELTDKFTNDFYALYAASDKKWDPLRDKQYELEPIMGKVQYSEMIPEITLMGDGPYMYKDPEDPQSSAFNNRVGMRPIQDSFRNPTQPSRFDNVELIIPPDKMLNMVLTQGQQCYAFC